MYGRQVSRREMLSRCANGFGGLALASLLAEKSAAGKALAPHFAAKAKSVIFLFMDGGPSQIDTFDPKPRLIKDNGQSLPFKPPTTVFNISDKILGSPFAFKKHGQSGADVSELFPHVAPASTTWPSSARWSPIIPSTPPPITSCTPAPAFRADRAWADG